jgi:hypothetical protein
MGGIPVMRQGGARSSAPQLRALGTIMVASLAFLIVYPPPSALVNTLFLATVAAAALEFARRASGRERWWIAYVALVPWAYIVLVPWTYFSWRGDWTVLHHNIDPHLPRSWGVHLAALVGITFGALISLVLRRRDSHKQLTPYSPVRLRPRRLNLLMGALLLVYGASFVFAGRPLAALWKLSGTVVYGIDVDESTGLLFLDQSLDVGIIVLLVYAAGRRFLHKWPSRVEIGWLLLYALLALGSGVRERLFFLVLGWAVVQFGPEFHGLSRQRPRRVVALVVSALALVATVQLSPLIAEKRARVDTADASPLRRAIKTTEVIGSGEALLTNTVQLGVLGGRSYTELPWLFIPRRFSDSKEGPASDSLVRERLSRTAGLSAPLWFEAGLNYGYLGVFGFMSIYAFTAVLFLRRLRRQQSRLAAAGFSLGAVWLLLSYVTLSRLTLFQAIVGILAALLGIGLGSTTLRWKRSGRALPGSVLSGRASIRLTESG